MKHRPISRGLVLAVSVLVIGFVSVGEAHALHAVTSVSPGSLPQGASSAPITITGTGFDGTFGASVTVSGTGVTVSNVIVASATSITAVATVAEGATVGARNVIVAQGSGGLDTDTCPGCLTITAGPVITSIAPPAASNTAITNLTATGTGFVAGAQLRLQREGSADIVATSTTVNGAGTTISGLVDLVGRAPGRWIVVVTNPNGGRGTFGNGTTTGFLVTANSPTVTSVTPATRAAGTTGSVLTLTGTNFAREATVSFGPGVTVTIATWVSPTSYSVTVDIAADAAPGPRSVTLTNNDSQASPPCNCFTVTTAPTITSVVPSSRGQGATSEDLVVTGTGFATGAAASVSGTGVTVDSVVRDSTTQLTVTVSVASDAPATARTLTVLNPDGGTATAPFTVNLKPTISSMTPGSRGQNASTQQIVVTGASFVATPAVAVSGTGVTVDSVVFNSSTQLTLVVSISPTAAVGPRDVTVTNPDGGTSTAAGAFTVNVGPSIVSLTPDALATGVSHLAVIVSGGGFAVTPTVSFSGTGITVHSVVRNTSNQLTLDVSIASDAPLGDRDVTVTNPDGGTVTDVAAFRVTKPPTVAGVVPGTLGQGATDDLTITGTGFLTGAGVSVSGAGVTVNTVTVVSSTELTANVTVANDAATGARNVTVTNPDAGSATCTACLTVGTGPSITSITPSGGHNSGTVTITNLAGSGFAPGAVVQLERAGFHPVPMDGETVNGGGTSITGSFDLTPAGGPPVAPGAWTVRVTNPADGGTDTLVDGFTVTGSLPTVTSASPAAVAQGTTTPVQVNGTGFAEGAVVTFSGTGITINSTTVVSSTRVDVSLTVAAAATPGPRTITVTNTDSQSASCVDCLTVNAAPTTTSIAPDTFIQGASGPVTITGTAYAATPTVTASGTGVTFSDVVRVSATQLTATITVAAGATVGSRTLTVTNPDGGTSTCTGCLTITAAGGAPTVTGVNPSSRGQGAANQTIVVTGTGFVGSPTVAFSGTGITVNNVVRDSATQLTVTISVAPGATVGARNVTVTNPDAGAGTCPGCFTVNAAPTTTLLSPSTFDQGATGPVTITGTGYVATPTVTPSGTGVTFSNVVRVSATQLTATITVTPTATTGGRTVTVTNPDGGFSTCACLTITAPGDIALAGWQGLGNAILNGPAVASAAPNTSAVLFRAPDNSLQVRPFFNNTFGSASSLGGIVLAGPGAAPRGNAIDVVARGNDNAVWTNTCTGPTCTGWVSLGGLTQHAPSVVSSAPGRLDVFATGLDAQLWQRTAINGTWGPWTPLGGILRAGPAVTSGGPNLLDVLMRGNDGAVWARSFNVTWGPFIRLGGFIFDEPAGVSRPGGILDLFVRGGDNGLWYARRVGGVWGGFQPLGGVLSAGPGAALISTSPNHEVQIAARGSDGRLYVNRATF